MNDILTITNLKKDYGSFKLDIPSLSIPRGLIVGFVGENGAGKTTTIKSIFSLIQKDSGKILFEDKDIDKLDFETREHLALGFDDITLPPRFKLENLRKYGKMLFKAWDDEKWNSLITKLSLPTDKFIKDFSKGTKAKAQLAFILSHNPSLLVLDEVTSSMDPVIRDEVLNLLQEFIEDGDKTVLLSSHLTSDLDKIADMIIFIHKGKIVLTVDRDGLDQKLAIVRTKDRIFNEDHIIAAMEKKYSYEFLIDNRDEFIAHNPDAVVDKATIEEIMLFIARGSN